MTAPDTCRNGHPRTPENTMLRSNGTKMCRECRRAAENKRQAKRKVGKRVDPEQFRQYHEGYLEWLRYKDREAMSLGDERQEALLRLAYRHPSEYIELLEEVKSLNR